MPKEQEAGHRAFADADFGPPYFQIHDAGWAVIAVVAFSLLYATIVLFG